MIDGPEVFCFTFACQSKDAEIGQKGVEENIQGGKKLIMLYGPAGLQIKLAHGYKIFQRKNAKLALPPSEKNEPKHF